MANQSPISIALVLIIFSAYSIDWCLGVGRNPTAVEHNACRVKWAEHVNEVKRTYKDDRATIRAINKGLDGSPCMTACRISFRGNVKDMDDIYTPDDVQCSTGPFPRFCQKGRCVLPVNKFRGDEFNSNNNNNQNSNYDENFGQ